MRAVEHAAGVFLAKHVINDLCGHVIVENARFQTLKLYLFCARVRNSSSIMVGFGVFANPDFPPVAPATPDEQVTVGSLAAGATEYLSLTIRSVPQHWWHSYVLADAYNSIPEYNETNNLASSQVLP